MNSRILHPKVPLGIQNNCEESQTLSELRRTLAANRLTQERLKVTRDTIRGRMGDLEEFIATFRNSIEHPPATALLSYIKFERNVFTTFKEQMRIAQQPSEPRHKQEEDAEFMIKLNQAKAQKKRQELSVKDLSNDPKQINFEAICKGTQFRCGLDVYRAWVDARRVKDTKRLFTLQEDQRIEALHLRYGENWDKVCQELEARSIEDIYYEYQNRINPHLVTGRWSIRHTLMLIILLEHFGAKRWATIARKMGVKSELQVRERFCNLVDPTIGKDVWTFEMEKRLLEVAEETDFCWRRISLMPIFKNKTDNCIWRKYKCLMIRFTEEEIREMLPSTPKYRGLAEKVIKEKRVTESRKRAAKNRPKPPIYFNQFRPKGTSNPPDPNKTSSVIKQAPSQSQMFSEEQSHMGAMMELEEEYFEDFGEND